MGQPNIDPQKQPIKELKKKLEQAQQKLAIYEKVFKVSRKELGIDIIKNLAPSCPRFSSQLVNKYKLGMSTALLY